MQLRGSEYRSREVERVLGESMQKLGERDAEPARGHTEPARAHTEVAKSCAEPEEGQHERCRGSKH